MVVENYSPQPVCLTKIISRVPSRCWLIRMLRRASLALPPALRMICASPRSIPKAAAGSMRASIQVTLMRSVLIIKVRIFNSLPTRYFFAGGRARSPDLNSETYCSFFETRFFWFSVAMAMLSWSKQLLTAMMRAK